MGGPQLVAIMDRACHLLTAAQQSQPSPSKTKLVYIGPRTGFIAGLREAGGPCAKVSQGQRGACRLFLAYLWWHLVCMAVAHVRIKMLLCSKDFGAVAALPLATRPRLLVLLLVQIAAVTCEKTVVGLSLRAPAEMPPLGRYIKPTHPAGSLTQSPAQEPASHLSSPGLRGHSAGRVYLRSAA